MACSPASGGSIKRRVGVSEAIDLIGFGKFQLLLGMSVGLAYVADAAEMLLLSILGPALRCGPWKITDYQEASLTTVVFIGMFLGSPIFGIMADKLGRKPTLISATVCLMYFGFLTACSPTFHWVLFLRFLVGFLIGSVPQACTLFIEYQPSKFRAKGTLILAIFWGMGGVFIAVTAWIVMPAAGGGWRVLVGLSLLPLVGFILSSPWCPESPLYLASAGKESKVYTQINRVAWANGQREFFDTHELSLGESLSATKNRGNFLDLLTSGRLKVTLMVWVMWFCSAATYYGSVLLGTSMLVSSNHFCGGGGQLPKPATATLASSSKAVDNDVTMTSQNNISDEAYCSVNNCIGLSESDYVELIWTTFAEFPGCILAISTIDRFGRKNTMVMLYALYTVAVTALAGCSAGGKGLLLTALFAARGASSAVFQVIFLYTPEIYPTNLRAVAMGAGSSVARIGAMLTPFLAQVMIRQSLKLTVGVYAGLGVLAGVMAWLLPMETKGVDLSETGHQFTSNQPNRLKEEQD